MLSEIPANIPPWLRRLYEAEQLMQLARREQKSDATVLEAVPEGCRAPEPVTVRW